MKILKKKYKKQSRKVLRLIYRNLKKISFRLSKELSEVLQIDKISKEVLAT